jgi:hypothetical protein
MTVQSWVELKKEIETDGDIKVVYAWQLRDAAGWAKLGPNVIVDIANQLEANDLGTLPRGERLPLNQNAPVRVYVKSSRLGNVIEAVLSPSAKGDDLLREVCSDSNDAAAVLERVRSIVCPVPSLSS